MMTHPTGTNGPVFLSHRALFCRLPVLLTGLWLVFLSCLPSLPHFGYMNSIVSYMKWMWAGSVTWILQLTESEQRLPVKKYQMNIRLSGGDTYETLFDNEAGNVTRMDLAVPAHLLEAKERIVEVKVAGLDADDCIVEAGTRSPELHNELINRRGTPKEPTATMLASSGTAAALSDEAGFVLVEMKVLPRKICLQ